MMMKKKCPKCKILKNRSEFYRDKTKKSGFGYQCKKCVAEYYKQPEYMKKSATRSRRFYHKPENRRKILENIMIRNIKLKVEMGAKCQCLDCPRGKIVNPHYITILAIDHILSIKKSGLSRKSTISLTHHLLKHPEERKKYQLLCPVCNISKGYGEKCTINHDKEMDLVKKYTSL